MRAFSHISQGQSLQPLLWASNGSHEIRSLSYQLVAHRMSLTPE